MLLRRLFDAQLPRTENRQIDNKVVESGRLAKLGIRMRNEAADAQMQLDTMEQDIKHYALCTLFIGESVYLINKSQYRSRSN